MGRSRGHIQSEVEEAYEDRMRRSRGHIQSEVEEAYEDRMRRKRYHQQQEKNKIKNLFEQCGAKCKTTIGLSLLALGGYSFYKFK
jgi:hypothetical protein